MSWADDRFLYELIALRKALGWPVIAEDDPAKLAPARRVSLRGMVADAWRNAVECDAPVDEVNKFAWPSGLC